jgi:hypothetical protein
LTPWEESVARRSGMTISSGGEAAPGRGKGGDDASWIKTNLTRPKNKKNTQSIQLLQMDGQDLKQW